jgi:hypothetical protein
MLRNKTILLIFFFVIQISFCSSGQKITSPSQSEFHSFWDHSVVPPMENSSDDTKSQPQTNPKKKK